MNVFFIYSVRLLTLSKVLKLLLANKLEKKNLKAVKK